MPDKWPFRFRFGVADGFAADGDRRAPEPEDVIGHRQDDQRDADPKDSIFEERSRNRHGECVLFGRRPVPREHSIRGEPKRIQQRRHSLIVHVHEHRNRNRPRHQQGNTLRVDRKKATGQRADGKEDGAEEKDTRQQNRRKEDENATRVGR